MRKLFAVLFCSFVMAGYAFAEELSYEIDPVATAKAPWKVGERIVKKGDCGGGIDYDREFLGMAQSGLAVVQDFYLSGEKLSDPVLMSVTTTEEAMDKSCFEGIEGPYTVWYKGGQKAMLANFSNGKGEGLVVKWHGNGQIMSEGNYKNDQIEGLVTMWYENGHKRYEGNIKHGEPIGIWRYWDEEGNLIEEKDYGTPKD